MSVDRRTFLQGASAAALTAALPMASAATVAYPYSATFLVAPDNMIGASDGLAIVFERGAVDAALEDDVLNGEAVWMRA